MLLLSALLIYMEFRSVFCQLINWSAFHPVNDKCGPCECLTFKTDSSIVSCF